MRKFLLSLYLATLLLPAPARAWTLPDTGQTLCYDTSGAVIACSTSGSYPGQDGAYAGSKPTYNDNGDGTVTDLNTGLMWQKATSPSAVAWAAAGTYCAGLGLDGYGDWRLPTQVELRTIVNAGATSPACDAVFSCHTDKGYWSSTVYAGDTAQAWAVTFSTGFSAASDKANTYYARCVRSGP